MEPTNASPAGATAAPEMPAGTQPPFFAFHGATLLIVPGCPALPAALEQVTVRIGDALAQAFAARRAVPRVDAQCHSIELAYSLPSPGGAARTFSCRIDLRVRAAGPAEAVAIVPRVFLESVIEQDGIVFLQRGADALFTQFLDEIQKLLRTLAAT